METSIKYTTALLAKEKGYEPKDCNNFFIGDELEHVITASKSDYNITEWMDKLNAPSQTELQTWLREEYNINALMDVCSDLNKRQYGWKCNVYTGNKLVNSVSGTNGFEHVFEIGLTMGLKLIKLKLS